MDTHTRIKKLEDEVAELKRNNRLMSEDFTRATEYFHKIYWRFSLSVVLVVFLSLGIGLAINYRHFNSMVEDVRTEFKDFEDKLFKDSTVVE